MRRTDQNLSGTVIGHGTREERLVRVDTRDQRPQFQGAPVCASLAQHHIVHVGVARQQGSWEVVRTKLGGTYFQATLAGEGQVVVDGRWQPCRSGEAFLLPPGTRHRFRALPRRRWDHCWVAAMRSPQDRDPSRRRPRRLSRASIPGRCVTRFSGFMVSAPRRRAPETADGWAELIHRYVTRFAEPAAMDARLWRLWETVAADLGHRWTTSAMARVANVSEKHLERLAKRELGRTPRQQLIWLRMRRAAELLADERLTIENVAAQVGYENPFVFSTTFKRIIGWPPSKYPGRRSSHAVAPTVG